MVKKDERKMLLDALGCNGTAGGLAEIEALRRIWAAFQYLTSDPDKRDDRERKNRLIERLPVMSESAALLAIESAMLEAAKEE